MNRKQIVLLAVALLAGLLAAYLSLSVVNQPAPPPERVVEKLDTADVLVMARNVERGEDLGNFAVEWRSWPKALLSPDMITKDAMPTALEDAARARARLPMVAGEPVVETKLARPGERGFLTAILPTGRRGIAIPITEASAVSGFILPDDRVDVILTRSGSDESGERKAVSQTLFRNVRVLAINQTLKAGPDGATVPEGRNAVLELDPAQTEILLQANNSGTLSLSLRPLSEGGEKGHPADAPVLDEKFLNPHRTSTGTLVIRYGVEQSTANR